jgi:hypothetical protein
MDRVIGSNVQFDHIFSEPTSNSGLKDPMNDDSPVLPAFSYEYVHLGAAVLERYF